MEALIVYGLVILFFIGTIGLLIFVVGPDSQRIAEQSQNDRQVQLDGQQNSALNYGIVAVLFLLLIVLTFATRRGQQTS
ncbi:MAG: hypothetical protein NVS2B12_04850 [Ktedonobacteraceae bacterium]